MKWIWIWSQICLGFQGSKFDDLKSPHKPKNLEIPHPHAHTHFSILNQLQKLCHALSSSPKLLFFLSFSRQYRSMRMDDKLMLTVNQGGRFITMSEASGSSYNSNYRGHVCDMDQCVLRTSLQLHNFGRRFYGCRHWKPGSDEHCKSFKWLDGIPCRRGAETAPIVIAKFSRLEAEAAMAKNNEMEARAMIADLLHRERVAKRSVEKARVSLRMANARARKYQIALLMSWLVVVVFFIISLGNREVGLRQMCLP
ncbi:uncharacterized protein LOC111985046 isoform X1 [Quercus suber]|uniref:GRF-type domain-containing protein n=1 Tax=Quercus suber TaxID=58331 RepID=A0AAW0KYJ6_QUESU|nr:uncharacterized protein LOC111985046 isoform X1 [Quercus suber]